MARRMVVIADTMATMSRIMASESRRNSVFTRTME
jgi:hypothetical protein